LEGAKMDRHCLDQVGDALRQYWWGYKVFYYPEYKDFVVTKKYKKKWFIFWRTVTEVDYTVKKEDMDWTEESASFTSLLFGSSTKYYFMFIDTEHKIILYR
jgi:hypothetical protein